jgi:beta-phosphoglucomutase
VKPLADIPGIGPVPTDSGMVALHESSDGRFRAGADGVVSITATGDRKVEFVAFARHSLALVLSELGYPAYYPVHPVALEKPVQAVLMDLDGTSVRSERFWIDIIRLSIASLMKDPGFQLEAADQPYVSGHSVSEHLSWCIAKYCPGRPLEEARDLYFEHTHREMRAILETGGGSGAFEPTPGLKEFLLALRKRGIRIGLVTSGLYEKAWPEILSAFRTMGMGDPAGFYDAIISAGHPLRKGSVGTLGELSPKPHPWLYAETCRVGLGIPFARRGSVIGIDDSGAGVCSVRIAGFPTVGFGGGNIDESGTRALCTWYCDTFEQVLGIIG